jgi:hypothetical protein
VGVLAVCTANFVVCFDVILKAPGFISIEILAEKKLFVNWLEGSELASAR